jgi:hypothetical protein
VNPPQRRGPDAPASAERRNLATLDIGLRDDLGTRYRWRAGSDTDMAGPTHLPARRPRRRHHADRPKPRTSPSASSAPWTSRSPSERTSTPSPPCSTCRA